MVPERVRLIRAAKAQLLADADELAEKLAAMREDEIAGRRVGHALAWTVLFDRARRRADVVGHGRGGVYRRPAERYAPRRDAMCSPPSARARPERHRPSAPTPFACISTPIPAGSTAPPIIPAAT